MTRSRAQSGITILCMDDLPYGRQTAGASLAKYSARAKPVGVGYALLCIIRYRRANLRALTTGTIRER
jgi:hypothetical protein